eukprot:gnl/TRDRNA2_/TRDRNA2_41201_c0_seq1.p1 gnl/TRDRNA2_/TRDRNA2_41201_c0~~gnl/TRDRNA2_/TRDRNA2_41201_c0_seq1.p1  ORF type:complete len:398 (-),score=54.72 gnl/TRDRNA2_/TRDRNA2_41201_c0_seq1:101-1171(-)
MHAPGGYMPERGTSWSPPPFASDAPLPVDWEPLMRASSDPLRPPRPTREVPGRTPSVPAPLQLQHHSLLQHRPHILPQSHPHIGQAAVNSGRAAADVRVRSHSQPPSSEAQISEPFSGSQKRKAEWEKAAATVDEILRGPSDHLIQNPGQVQCRLCRKSLSGNIDGDQLLVANYRLVNAIDFAWVTAERLFQEKADVQQAALAKQRELEEMRKLVAHLRAEYPSRVHSYLMRSLNKPRERLAQLNEELQELRAAEQALGGEAWASQNLSAQTIDNRSRPHPPPAAAAAAALVEDAEWLHFRGEVGKQVTRWGINVPGKTSHFLVSAEPVKIQMASSPEQGRQDEAGEDHGDRGGPG